MTKFGVRLIASNSITIKEKHAMNVMAALLKIYGFLDILADNNVSDLDFKHQIQMLLNEMRIIFGSEGLVAKYSNDLECYVLVIKE